MTIYNMGTIDLGEELTDEALKIVKKHFGDIEVEAGDDELEFEEYLAQSLDEDLNKLISELAPLGYVLDGTIEYWGDYDGKYYIENNVVKSVDIEDTGLFEASDEQLIKILTERGYTVTNKADARDAKITRLTNLLQSAINELIEGADEDYQGNLADLLGMTEDEADLFGLPVREEA